MTHIKIGRNEKCPCGSGKKFKKCCIYKKERKFTMTYDFGEGQTISGIEVDSKKGGVKFFNKGKQVFEKNIVLEKLKKRMKSDKILTRHRLQKGNKGFNDALSLSGYDHIFAIDTNTKKRGNKWESVGVIVQCICNNLGDQTECLVQEIAHIKFTEEIRKSPEKLSWMAWLKELYSRPEFQRRPSVAIVVDHDLDKLESYNLGLIPIYDAYFLPAGVKLIYASADNPNETLANKLISKADKCASKYLKN
jgi:hypothetical protein